MDGQISRREVQHPGGDGNNTQALEAHQQAGGDVAGVPLPWSRDSVVWWAQQNGFAKFIPTFIQTMRDMRIPNVSMQDLIQLNAAIYRLNASGAAAAASRPQVQTQTQAQVQPLHPAPLPPQLQPQAPHPAPLPPQLQSQVPLPGKHQEPASNTHILSHPLQPLRPPRPSWTLRRDDPQPTYSRQVQLTANGMVARPVRVRPPVTYNQQPLDPSLQLQNVQREGAGLPSVPFSINTGVGPTHDILAQQASTGTAGSTSTAKTWTSRLGPSPHSPYREGQTSAANNTATSGTGDRTPRYNPGLSTYRSRNSAHVEIDELPFVRPGQSAWSPQLQPQGSIPPNQQRPPPGPFAPTPYTALGNPPRRRSAVIDVADDLALVSAELPSSESPAPRVPRLTPAPLPPRLAPTLPALTPATASGTPTAALPARYHGTNQAHSPYYAHGASATAGSFSYRGVSSPSSSRSAYATVPQSGGSRYAPVDMSSSAEPSRYLTRRTAGQRQHGSRSGMRGLFEQNAHVSAANPPAFANTAPAATVSRPPLTSDSRKPHPYSKEAAARVRRTSISPVLSALKPGNYHIANLPDDLDSSSSDMSDSSTGRRVAKGALSAPNHMANVPLSSSSGGSKFPFVPGSAPSAIITSIFARDFGISPCDTGDSIITPLSVVNVLPGSSFSPHSSPQTQVSQITPIDSATATMPTEGASANFNNRFRLQMAFGNDVEDLPSASLRRAGTHLRSPSMPASLVSSRLGSEYSGTGGGDGGGSTAASERPHSTVDQITVDPTSIDRIRHDLLDNGLSDGSQAMEKGTMLVFDAESMDSADDDDDGSLSVGSHFDLVENAASITWSEEHRGDMPDVWDAEEIADDYGERPSALPMAIFDAEEVEDGDDGGLGDELPSSPVRIDAYETESIFSVPALQHEHDEYEEGKDYMQSEAAMVTPTAVAAQSGDHEQQVQASLPLRKQVSNTVITPLSQGVSGVVSSATTLADRQQQDSSAFKVKGVRHVLSYGADFDKTAANLLSSIKTNIAKKAAATGANATSRPVPNASNAASIAAAIELHQLKQQQQQQQQQPPPILHRHEIDEPGSSLSAEQRHTSRLSGFFGFGPRVHKHHQAPPPPTTIPTQQQQPAAPPTSMPQSQNLALGASGSAAGLRVVTDFQSLRGSSSGSGIAAAAIGNTDPSSAEGKKSASPSTLPRRWRVPFRPRTAAAAATATTGLSGEHAYSQQLSSESPLGIAADKGHESEASTSATPRTESASQRTLRRSRYRAGTTSDIESPQTAAALLSTMDRPYSMVESVTSGSAGSAGGSALTPGSATTTRLPPPHQMLPPGAPQTAPKTIAGGDKSSRRTNAHFQHSTSPVSPLVGRMFRDGRRRSGIAASDDMSPSAGSGVPLSSVFVRREQDTEFVQVDISRLMSGAAVAERLVCTLHGGGAMPVAQASGMSGEWRFAVQSPDGSQSLVDSDGELWTHCIRARAESPAAFVLCDGDSYQQHYRPRLRFQPTRKFGGDGSSSSGSESEICSAVPLPFGGRAPPPFARSALAAGGGSGYETGSVSPSSFVTANSSSSLAAASRGVGQLAIGDDAVADSSPSSLSRADSWTLMFVNKEFVVAKPSPSSQDTISSATLTIGDGSVSGLPTPMQVMGATSDNGNSDEGSNEDDDDNDLWGGAAPTTGVDDDPVAEAMRADIAELQAAAAAAAIESDNDDSRSIASSTRTLPSTMRFTRGMRATLLERRPSRNVYGRPTADMIGEQLDEYFPDHDLDRPIVQSVPMDEGMLPSQEFHIILDEDDGTATAAYQGRGQGEMQGKHRRHMKKILESDDDGAGGGPPPGSGIGRRKSVRMLVQETRQQRQLRRPRQRVVTDKRATAADPAVARPPRPVVRRQSTKLWGCIPEEIRPRDERMAATVSVQSSAPRGNDEIVRRALSLLRKPEPNPQAEKEIVEAAIKCGDNSTAGSTRAHFTHERARLQAMTDDDDMSLQANSGGGSVNDAARALFAKYGIAMAGIKIQWIKGKLIGKGSFGHVHVAINAATGEVIAVKQIRLPASLCAATGGSAPMGSSRRRRGGRDAGLLEEAIRMMYTEVELLRDLDHENVVQLLGFEVAGGVMSMFLEYVPGGTVQSLVQQHGPLPESVVHSFLRQIVAGLGYLHSSGILHRDIKGANILVDETGTCKISDFGVSRKVDCTSLAAAMSGDSGVAGGARKRSIKAAGKILGTVPFMAPEVARSSQYTAAADIWSLGCVVVQMWSGRGPWDELQEPQVFFKLGRGEAPPIPDDLTEPGLEFCKNCFAADPLARWTAAELGCMQFAQVPREYEYPYTN
ncbi:mitogen-activated protein kinase kinase kinase [Coemansia sp. RSA 2050]|nr:mitogen-activated protein kinase kinase kinase [Coemansia sp. RSA 2050]KAJ2733264.1 mitogen-activated protein kinase kinase kinase [Coemansia sp. BCRC 34962]